MVRLNVVDIVSLRMDVQSNVKQNLNRNLWETGPNDSEAHLEKQGHNSSHLSSRGGAVWVGGRWGRRTGHQWVPLVPELPKWSQGNSQTGLGHFSTGEDESVFQSFTDSHRAPATTAGTRMEQ